ncbi:MAG TPA: ComF family protein [Chthoniobacterales bacterium]
MIALLQPWGTTVLELLYPSHCLHCQRPVPARSLLCAACTGEIPWLRPPFCLTCSRPFPGAAELVAACPNCLDQTFAFGAAVAAVRATGSARELIHRFKYGGKHHLRRILGTWLVTAFEDARIQSEPVDALVPVPLHPTRRRERGYNQAEELASLLSARVKVPTLPCLQRTRYTDTQTQFDRAQRRRNLRNAFQLRKGSDVARKRLLLIDDVLTTGSTLDECARVLVARGATSVRALTVARG